MHINFIFLRYSLFISVITFAHGRTMVVVDGTGRAFTTNTTFSGSIVTIRQPSQFIEATLSAIATGTAALTINITDRFIQQPSSPPILTINITDRLIQPSSSPTITTSSTATSTSAEPGESQTGTGTAQTDIIVALRSNPDTTQFADRLDGDPDFNKLVQRVNEKTKSNITIFAPANDAMEKYYQGILQRTDDKYESEVARQFTYRALGEEDIYSAPLVWNVLDSDSQHVNLGENEPQRLVSEPEDNKNVAIISGLGRKVSVCSDGIGFSLGCIKATSDWFTPPLTLDLTLQELGHTGFLDALKREKLLDKYSTTAKVIVFVPQNANNSPLSLEDLKRHVIVGEFGYTPVLKIGKAYSSQSGAKLNVSQKNSEYSVNGVRIVQSNIILENGVMHVLGGRIEKGVEQEPTVDKNNDAKKSEGMKTHLSLSAAAALVIIGLYSVWQWMA